MTPPLEGRSAAPLGSQHVRNRFWRRDRRNLPDYHLQRLRRVLPLVEQPGDPFPHHRQCFLPQPGEHVLEFTWRAKVSRLSCVRGAALTIGLKRGLHGRQRRGPDPRRLKVRQQPLVSLGEHRVHQPGLCRRLFALCLTVRVVELRSDQQQRGGTVGEVAQLLFDRGELGLMMPLLQLELTAPLERRAAFAGERGLNVR